MRKRLIALAAVSALGAAAPGVVSAQAYPGGREAVRWTPISEREHWLFERIEYAEHTGQIDRFQTQSLKGEFKDVLRLERQYRKTDGRLDPWEREDLERRFDHLSRRIPIDAGGHAWQYRRDGW